MKPIFLLLALPFGLSLAAQPPSNTHFSHTLETTAPRERIWQVWTHVSEWSQWDTGLRAASLEGPFIAGTKGKLLPDKGPKARFALTEVVANQSYTFKTRIPLGWLVVRRYLEVQEGITFFTHEVSFTGPLKGLLGRKLGKRYRLMLPEVMAKVDRQARQVN